MNLPPTAYLVTGPGYRRPLLAVVDAVRLARDHGGIVQALVLATDAAGMLHERLNALRAEHAAEMAEAEAIIAALAGQLALLHQRAP